MDEKGMGRLDGGLVDVKAVVSMGGMYAAFHISSNGSDTDDLYCGFETRSFCSGLFSDLK